MGDKLVFGSGGGGVMSWRRLVDRLQEACFSLNVFASAFMFPHGR